MAYSDSTRERMDELRFRNQQSPRTDTTFNGLGLVSPPRNGTTRLPPPLQQQDARGGLMRRFTADSARVPTMSSLTLTTQRGGQEQDFGPSVRLFHPQGTMARSSAVADNSDAQLIRLDVVETSLTGMTL